MAEPERHPQNETQAKMRRASRGERAVARWDLAIAEAFEPVSETRPVRALAAVGELADQPPLIAASLLTAALGGAIGDRRLMRTGLRMLAAHALATGVKSVVKDHVDRPRPGQVGEDGEHDIEVGGDDDEERSLPSGHTAGAVAVARAIVREYPGAARMAYGFAALAAGIQVPRHAHYPSDVAVGTVIGLAAEAIVHAAARDAVRLLAAGPGPRHSPAQSAGGAVPEPRGRAIPQVAGDEGARAPTDGPDVGPGATPGNLAVPSQALLARPTR
jgi:membrane-associated phospholipid phosphatase